MPSLAVWAPTARDRRRCPARRARWRWSAARTASGACAARPSWRDAEYAFDVDGRVVTDPYSVALTRQLDALGAGRAPAARATGRSRRRSAPSTPRSTSCTSATSRSATRACRAEHRGTYLAFTHDSARHAPPAHAGRGGPDHRAPAAVQRHRDDRGGSFSPARPRAAGPPPARLRGAAAPRRRGARARRLQLGLRPAALPRARGLLRASRTARASSGRWSARSTASACASCSTSSSTTRPRRLAPGPGRPRLLPPAHARPARSTTRRAARTPRPSTG